MHLEKLFVLLKQIPKLIHINQCTEKRLTIVYNKYIFGSLQIKLITFASNVFVDPHDVEIHGCGTRNDLNQDENTQCDLECRAENGNPNRVVSYVWYFKQRHTEEFVLLSTQTERTINMNSLSFRDAGIYKCKASNSGGNGEASDAIVVNCKYTYLQEMFQNELAYHFSKEIQY